MECTVQRTVLITIDGPAGTGKSTVAHHLARRLGLEFLDTGAMYRAAALIAIERGIEPADGEALARAVETADLHFDWESDPPRLLLDGRDISRRIRDRDVGEVVSIVAGQAPVRTVLVQQQRTIAKRHSRLVTEGRDQGSVVFPNADLRFYLDARPQVRARRRAEQLATDGREADDDRVLEDILRRDALDSTRTVGPLLRPKGAVVIDTSALSLDEVVNRLEAIARERLGEIDRDDTAPPHAARDART